MMLGSPFISVGIKAEPTAFFLPTLTFLTMVALALDHLFGEKMK